MDDKPVILNKEMMNEEGIVSKVEGVEIYTFNKAFDQKSNQEIMFEETVKY